MGQLANQVVEWMMPSEAGAIAIADCQFDASEVREWGLVVGLAFALVKANGPHLAPSQAGKAALRLAEESWVLLHPSSPVGAPCPLSERQVEVLRHLSEGKVYGEIAADMGLSASTIRTHLHNIYGLMRVTDRAQAVVKASNAGWLKGGIFERLTAAPALAPGTDEEVQKRAEQQVAALMPVLA